MLETSSGVVERLALCPSLQKPGEAKTIGEMIHLSFPFHPVCFGSESCSFPQHHTARFSMRRPLAPLGCSPAQACTHLCPSKESLVRNVPGTIVLTPPPLSFAVLKTFRLKLKLQSSATGMNSPEWDQHDRLTAQLSADQDAAAAAAAAASVTAASRGRSQSRTSRSGTHDEGSRSRSRSFTLPLRGWGAGKGGGERRQRWTSQDSDTHRSGRADTDGYRASRVDTDIEEESYRAIGSGGARQLSSGDTSTGGGGRTPDDVEEEEVEERPSRNKSFFSSFGRWGNGRLRSASSAQVALVAPSGGDSGDETTTEGSRGSSSGAAAATGGDGGGRRRHSSSAAYTLRGAAGQRSDSVRSRNNRFSSFTGERPTVAPSTGPSPESETAAVTFDPVSQKADKQPRRGARGGRLQRSRSMADTRPSEEVPEPLQRTRLFGKKKSWGRGKAARRVLDEGLESRKRATSTSADADPSSETPRDYYSRSTPDSRSTPGKGRWGGRGRTASSAGVEMDDDEDLGPRRRAFSTAAAAGGGGGASLGVTPDSRSKSSSATTSATRGGTADGDVGGGRGGRAKKKGFARTKGVWGSLQVSAIRDRL